MDAATAEPPAQVREWSRDQPAEPTDAELCEAVRRGREAHDAIVRRYEALVHKLVNKCFLYGRIDTDELTQAGRLALAKAAEKWNPDKGSKFFTYAYTCVNNAVRRAAGEQSRPPFLSLSHQPLDDEDAPGIGAVLLVTPPTTEELVEALPIPIRKRVNELHPVLRDVVKLWYGLEAEPLGTGRIAKLLGLTVEQVKTAHALAMEYLK
jgi:RNA polymerase sigma factor (sigma-70 family)